MTYVFICPTYKLHLGLFANSVDKEYCSFYPRDAMLVRVFARTTCPSICLSVCHTPVLCQNEESDFTKWSWFLHYLV